MSVGDIGAWVLSGVLLHSIALLIVVTISSFRKDVDPPPFSEIEIWLGSLLRNGHGGQTILFRHSRSGRFLHFEKYADAGGGIALTFPEIRWGREFVARLKAYCDDHGLPYRDSTAAGRGAEGCARIDVGNNLERALALSRTIWHDFFGYGEHDGHNRAVDDLLNPAEMMAVPQRALSRSEQIERFCAKTRARLSHIGLSWLGLFGFAAALLVAGLSTIAMLIGLPAATLLSLGDPPDWQIAIGPIQAQGSNVSLTFLIVYLVSYLSMRRCMRVRLIDWQNWNRVEAIVHRPKWLVFHAMPIAVILVWLGI